MYMSLKAKRGLNRFFGSGLSDLRLRIDKWAVTRRKPPIFRDEEPTAPRLAVV